MAYRDPPLVAPKPVPNAALPARLVGIAALVLVVYVVTKLYAISDDTYLRWYRAGSAMPQVLYWIAYGLRLALVPFAVFFGVRADSPRARMLAWVGAGFLFLSLAVNLWAAFHPVVPELDRTRPYWAPPKRVVPWTDHVGVDAHAIGLAAIAWALARRESRTLATIATAFAFAMLFRDVMSALEVPWMQLLSPDKNASKVAQRAAFFMSYVEMVAVGLAGALYRPRTAPDADADVPAYHGIAPLVAAVTAATVPLAMFGMANAWMTMARGERDFDNWMSASGIVRMEYFEDLAYLPYGAFLCAAGFCVWAAVRARQPPALFGVAWLALAIVSVGIFMRGRWKVPISPQTDFGSFQVGWALVGTALFGLVALLSRRLATDARVSALDERDDIRPTIATAAGGISSRIVVACGLSAAGVLALALGDATSSRSLHETLAVAGGIASVLGWAAALAAAAIHVRGRDAIEEALRRRGAATDVDRPE